MKKIIIYALIVFSFSNYSCSKNAINTNKISKSVAGEDYSKDSLYSENNLEDGWKEIRVEEMGSVNLPPEMEIQGGEYKKINDNLYEMYGFNNKNIVFQQKGLNDLNKNVFNTYARVLLKTKISTPNSTSNLTDKIEISTSELKEFDYTLKNELSKSFTIVNWYPSEIISINDMYALLTSYERQSNSDPVVLVKMYQFQNNDRTHSITMSYRITDKDKWEIIFEKILNSLTIKTFD